MSKILKNNDSVSSDSSLDFALKYLKKQFGENSVMSLGQKPETSLEVISTGSPALDIALGIGGFPKGRVVEIYGPESSGKTTFALSTIHQCQKKGGIAAFIDVEHALDAKYAADMGIDLDSVLLSQPDSGEGAFEIATTLAKTGKIDLIVIDSVAALTPKSEIDGDMESASVGVQARLMSKGLRKLVGVLSENNCMAIFINQIREKIGVLYGNPETTSGGNALKFYASVRLDIRRISNQNTGMAALKAKGSPIGEDVRIKVVKNKVAAPFGYAETRIEYGKGINKIWDIVVLAEGAGIFERSGSWYSYNGEKLCQGKENAVQMLKDNPELLEEVEHKVYESAGILRPKPSSSKKKAKQS